MAKALSGKGTVLAIGEGGTNEIFTPIAQLKTFQFSGMKRHVEDVSNSDSTAAEKIAPGVLDNGQLKVAGNYIGSDTGLQALRTALASGVAQDFKLTLPKAQGQSTNGDVFAFSAVVSEWALDVQFDKASTCTATLDIDGVLTFTAGA